MVEKELREDDAAIPVGRDFRETQVSLDVAVASARVTVQTHPEPIPEAHDLFDADVNSSGFLQTPLPGKHGVAAIYALLRSVR